MGIVDILMAAERPTGGPKDQRVTGAAPSPVVLRQDAAR
jgi:hypothetical protein